PRAAKWISDSIGEVEVERLKEAVNREQFLYLRRSKSYYSERRTEPLILPSEISGLPRMHALMKVDNFVVPFSFPYVDVLKEQPCFIAREKATQAPVIDIGKRESQPGPPLVQEIAPERPKDSTRLRASNWSDTRRHGSTSMSAAKQSERWSIVRRGTRLSPRPRVCL